jgi:hypothetical protein
MIEKGHGRPRGSEESAVPARPRHCAIVILAVDVAPFTTLVRRMAHVLPGRRLAGCSLAPESARP